MVQSLGLKASLEEEMVTHSSILAISTYPSAIVLTLIYICIRKDFSLSINLSNIAIIWHDYLFFFFLKRTQVSSILFSSVHFSCSVVSDFLWPHETQNARPPCPWQTPRVYSDSSPLTRWCDTAVSSSVVPFSSCPQSLPASGSFPMSSLDQSTLLDSTNYTTQFYQL